MSHFTVLVIGEEPEEALAPFQENNMGDCPKQYLEFNDRTEEFKDQYENETVSMLEHQKTGRRISRYSSEFSELIEPFIKEYTGKASSQQFVDSETKSKAFEWLLERDWKEVEISFKERYGTFEYFVKDYHGFDGPVTDDGRYGYYYNPNAKWDWYVLGGRWSGNFLPKKGKKGTLGEPGVFDNTPPEDYVDQARKGDIDWETMLKDDVKRLNEQYDKFEAKCKEEIPEARESNWKEWWEDNQYPNKHYPHKPQEEYENFAVFLAEKWREDCAEECGIIGIFGPKEIPDRETYINKNAGFSTWAVIDQDGEWHEPGEMGWWGMSTAEPEDEDTFREGYFDKFIKPLDDDVLLSVYDCHI